MKTTSRISTILKANCLDSATTGIPSFNLSELKLETDLEFQLPTNLRLGHMAERIVSELIKSSSNYEVLYENIQVTENKNTMGEIDFILKNLITAQIIHMELAYKFYLYDPTISSEEINNWIGPNRNDSLKEKLEKLKRKQFPLLHHTSSKSMFNTIDIDETSQALCFLVSLFIPYDYKANFSPVYEKAIQGYYINFETFTSIHKPEKSYYIPEKKEWGMDPSENKNWTDYKNIENYILSCMEEKQAPMCWQKNRDTYAVFFIVWW